MYSIPVEKYHVDIVVTKRGKSIIEHAASAFKNTSLGVVLQSTPKVVLQSTLQKM